MFKVQADHYKYILDFDIAPFTRADMNRKRMWDLTTAFKVRSHLSLVEQHAGRELLLGPLHLDCTFFIKFKGSLQKQKEYNQRPHMCRPYLSALLLLLESVGVDVIFKSAANIISINTQKYYDSEKPRVEFTLIETQKDIE